MKLSCREIEIGLIPVGWEIATIGDLCHIFGRIGFRGYTVKDIVDEGNGAIAINPSNIQGGKTLFENCTYISWYKYEESPEIKIFDGDVILVKTGSTFGKTAMVKNLPSKATLNPQMLVFKKIKSNPVFFSYILGFKTIQDQINIAVAGGALPTLSQKLIAKFKLSLPSTQSEQLAIAQSLSDVDDLLTTLDKSIEKKRNFKQAVMQQLLTGKTRLTGFKDKWSVKSLKSVGQCIRGVSYQGDADLSSHDKSYTKRLLRSNNIQNGFVVTNDIQFVNAKRVSDAQLLKKNDILICMANGSKFLVGKSGLFNVVDGDDYTFGAFMGAFRVNQKLADPRFVFFLFQTSQYKNYINNLLVGSSINNLTSGIIDSLEFYFPSYTEQEAIANILSNMDEELLKLEERLNKIKQLKQAMMQELLTGKTRLINKEFSNA